MKSSEKTLIDLKDATANTRKIFAEYMRDEMIYGFDYSVVNWDAEKFWITNINRQGNLVTGLKKNDCKNFVIVCGKLPKIREKRECYDKKDTKRYVYERVL